MYKRKSYRRYRPRFKRRTYRKKYASKRRMYRAVRKLRGQQKVQEVHVKSCIRAAASTAPDNAPAYTIGGALDVRLNYFSTLIPYRNMYQFYRINKVVVKFTPMSTGKDVIDVTNQQAPAMVRNDECRGMLLCAVDYEDSQVPVSETEVRSYQRMKQVPAFRELTMKWTPALLAPKYETGVDWGYQPQWKQWVRTMDYNVAHHGLKYWTFIDGGSNANKVLPRWNLDITVYVSFKSPIPGYVAGSDSAELTKDMIHYSLPEEKKEEESKTPIRVDQDDDILTDDEEKEYMRLKEKKTLLTRTQSMKIK